SRSCKYGQSAGNESQLLADHSSGDAQTSMGPVGHEYGVWRLYGWESGSEYSQALGAGYVSAGRSHLATSRDAATIRSNHPGNGDNEFQPQTAARPDAEDCIRDP